jgi:hypothetical protein
MALLFLIGKKTVAEDRCVLQAYVWGQMMKIRILKQNLYMYKGTLPAGNVHE